MSQFSAGQNTWQIAKQIVADAAELPPAERDAFVIEQCGDHAALLAEVQSLLAQLDGIDAYIEIPAVLPESAAPNDRDDNNTSFSLTGQTIGAYRLGAQVGSGGMGVVYAAERADGAYQQKVAIKLLRGGGVGSMGGSGNSEQDARRMARERQALAQLDHPHIARLLDGGTTPDAAPYLVMEFIDGEAIDKYCEHEQLDLRERVALVRGVCAAVQSAHQRLLIHRDIKPSNILVTREGTPKLLDFGIARLLEASTEGGSQPQDVTHATALLFTPRYASPEQVRGQAVTVATDVYGLGLLLYELLAGASPYERIASSISGSAAEAMVAVMQDAPRRASEVARKIIHGGSTSAGLNADSVRSIPGTTRFDRNPNQLEGELDTILLKACAKLPAERYQTVAQLDDDLARWLTGKPILARPQTWAYTFFKLVNRHRFATGMITLASTAIIAGVVGTVVQKNRAEHRYEQVRQIANTFIFKYYDEIESLPGATKLAKEMAGDGIKFLDDLYADAATNPSLAVELGAGYGRLSRALYNGRGLPSLGNKAGAAAAAEKAHALLESALSRIPNDAGALIEIAKLDRDEAALLGQEGDLDASLTKLDSSAARLEKVLLREPLNREAAEQLPQVLLAEALVQSQKGGADQTGRSAATYLDQARKAIDHWAAHYPDDPEIVGVRLLHVRRQFMNSMATGDYAACVRFADQEIAGYDAYLKKSPNDFAYGLFLQTALLNKGGMLNLLNQPDAALVALDRGLEVSEALSKADPKSIDAQVSRARIYFHHAKAFFSLGNKQAATNDFALSVAQYHLVEGKDIPPYARRHHGEALWWLIKMRYAEHDTAKLNQSVAELTALAKNHPTLFSKAPAADWVAEAQRMVKT